LPGLDLHRPDGGLGQLGGQGLRCGETDPDATPDRGDGHDLDVEVVAGRARFDRAARGEPDVPGVDRDGDRPGVAAPASDGLTRVMLDGGGKISSPARSCSPASPRR
jgi:hypothetical protein